jgi:hypothetical protein
MKQRLLFITHHELDKNNGGSNGSKGFLHCFASLFDDCSIICHEIEDTQPYIPANVKYYPMRDKRSKVRKLFDMYRGAISGHYYFVREHLKTHQYDIVVIDHTFTGAGLSRYIKATGAKLITIHHNVERDYLRDNSKEKPLLFRYPFLYYCKKSERDCLRNSALNLTVTEKDAAVFHSWFPNICVYNWGNFEYQPIEDKMFDHKTTGQTFIITGSLYFAQSLMPIMDFIRHYWPLVQQAYPQGNLLIAGRNPSTELQKTCAASKGITIIPNPDDIGEVVKKADYYICPIHSGSGRKLRICDGLRQGLPILCHDVAANGYEQLAANGCLFSYHDEQSFIAALHHMVDAKVKAQKVYQTYKETFSLDTGKERLLKILKKENII